MLPLATAADFCALSPQEKLRVRQSQQKRAMDFMLSSSHTLIGDEQKLLELSEKVFWASYVRLSNYHLTRLLRLYPEADRMLAKYGMDKEEILNIFLSNLCSLLLGVPFENHHDIKDAMERQANSFFAELDRHWERIKLPGFDIHKSKLQQARFDDSFDARSRKFSEGEED
jgi:hypothetical protein